MILFVWRYFRSLPRHYYMEISLSALLPTLFFLMLLFVSLPPFWKISFMVLVPLWLVAVVVARAHAVKRDKTKTEDLVTERVGDLPGRISKLKEEQESLRADLSQQVRDLEETVRATLKEELGVALPHQSIAIRASFTFGSPTASVTVVAARGSKFSRLQRWFRHVIRWLWEVAYGKPRRG